jgi:hypothetical protein
MFTSNLSNYPPGVTGADIERAYGWEEPARQRRCECGAFLPVKPNRREYWAAYQECDGEAKTYTFTYDEGTIAILGEEFRGKTYTERLAPCGEQESHRAHREVMHDGESLFWSCRRCGKEHRDEF